LVLFTWSEQDDMTGESMSIKGDTEKQAALRDRMIKGNPETEGEAYIARIQAVLKPGMRLLDIGCGTAHIVQRLAERHDRVMFVGLDASPGMLRTARANVERFPNVALVAADGVKLPFRHSAFDIAITRLAEYSPEEAYRVLKQRGYFFEYGLGPEADKEIAEFFPDRIEVESFSLPDSVEGWKDEVCKEARSAGFVVDSVAEHRENDYYRDEEELADLIEMVPLVRDFDREKDRPIIDKLAAKYRKQRGIRITWHYYIMQARCVQKGSRTLLPGSYLPGWQNSCPVRSAEVRSGDNHGEAICEA